MKKPTLIKLIAFALILTAFCSIFTACSQSGDTAGDYLRVHIRANSNSQDDQSVKYLVKAAVVEFLTPYLAGAPSKSQAYAVISRNLAGIERAANAVLAANGFAYRCTASLKKEQFPSRSYDSLTLESGVYDALILNLGTGNGDNWWCVVYPPLCFVGAEENGTNSVRYKSRLLEIICEFKNRK